MTSLHIRFLCGGLAIVTLALTTPQISATTVDPISFDAVANLFFYTGDFDRDGDVDADDIDQYLGNFGSPATGPLAELDLIMDGMIMQDDFEFHVENFVQTSNGLRGTILGDVNLDGAVNIFGDGFIAGGNTGVTGGGWGSGDVNLDGVVDDLDLENEGFTAVGGIIFDNALAMATNAGNPSIPTLPIVVPEPSATTLLLLSSVSVLRRRKRT